MRRVQLCWSTSRGDRGGEESGENSSMLAFNSKPAMRVATEAQVTFDSS